MATTTSSPSEAYIAFTGDIHSESVSAAVTHLDALTEEGVGRVVLIMHTLGGEIDAGMHLYERLRAGSFELVTHAVGLVASMGIPIYLAGETRRVGPQCRFELHRPLVKAEAGQQFDIPTLQQLGAMLEADEQRTRSVYEARTPLSGGEVDALKGSEAVLGAQEAVSRGIAHGVEPLVIPPGRSLVVIGRSSSGTS